MRYTTSTPARLMQDGRRGFSLTELMVVIGIMVMLMAMAVPAFNALTGQRSVEMAQNQVSTALAQARMTALSTQKKTGILFFRDAQDRVSIGIVQDVGAVGGTTTRQIDLVAGQRITPLQKGTLIQTMDVNGQYGFEPYSYLSDMNYGMGAQKILGLVLFDSKGRLDTSTAWRPTNADNSALAIAALGKPVGTQPPVKLTPGSDALPSPVIVAYSEKIQDPSIANMRSDGYPMLINRYNGTVMSTGGANGTRE